MSQVPQETCTFQLWWDWYCMTQYLYKDHSKTHHKLTVNYRWIDGVTWASLFSYVLLLCLLFYLSLSVSLCYCLCYSFWEYLHGPTLCYITNAKKCYVYTIFPKYTCVHTHTHKNEIMSCCLITLFMETDSVLSENANVRACICSNDLFLLLMCAVFINTVLIS